MRWFSRRRDTPRPLTIAPEDCTTEEELAARIAAQAAPLIPHEAIYVYWLARDRTAVYLRTVHSTAQAPQVQPGYGGLVADATLSPVPLRLDPPLPGEPPRRWGGTDEPWLEVAAAPYLLLRVRLPARTELPPERLRTLQRWLQEGSPQLALAHALLDRQQEAARLQGLLRSAHTALDALLRPEAAADLLLGLAASLFDASHGALAVAGQAGWRCLASRGDGAALWRAFHQAAAAPAAAGITVTPWEHAGRTYQVVGSLAVVAGRPLGGLFLFLPAAPEWDDYRRAVLQALGNRAGHLMAHEEVARQVTSGYLATLRTLVTAMDSMTPSSQGHSDRLARYARLTAQELGLPPAEVEAVALAAFLHDVGMVAIPLEVVLRPGRLTAAEYEQVKGHPEVGAQLVLGIPAALPLAPMVAAHHERWDGLGYPRGLRGEEIPLGARIIAVADAFDAKTTGRPYRAPLPFDQALAEIRQAAGTQFDPRVVNAFVRALARLRDQARPGLPMARCWEVKQLPAAVCAGCPNRQPVPVPCWEQPHRLCHRHGDNCPTCIVFTEALTRAAGGLVPAPLAAGGGPGMR